jgi:uncharacterized protein YyaL (SSP411 family)
MKRYLFIFLPIFLFSFTNSLIKEQSPYLKSHAKDPTNWYAWNNKIFALSANISLLLDILNGDKKALKMAIDSLDIRLNSGIYDQVDGAFFGM